MRMGELGFEFDGLLVFDDGFVHTALVPQGEADDVVGVGKLGVEFDGLPVLGDGLTHTAIRSQGVAKVVVGNGGLRTQHQRGSVVADRLLPSLGLDSCPSQTEIQPEIARITPLRRG